MHGGRGLWLWAALACGCAGAPPSPPAAQYELVPAPVGSAWPGCAIGGDPPGCGQVLAAPRDGGAHEPVCCWQCESGRNACSDAYWPGRPVLSDIAMQPRCAVARPADFDGGGAPALHAYLHWLARTYGAQAQLGPRDVALVIANGAPEPGRVGVTAGEVACSGAVPAFRITLYREALLGRPLAVAYNAIAHEFEHVLQIRRDGLACGTGDDARRERYERTAAAVAAHLMPSCERPRPSAAPTPSSP